MFAGEMWLHIRLIWQPFYRSTGGISILLTAGFTFCCDVSEQASFACNWYMPWQMYTKVLFHCQNFHVSTLGIEIGNLLVLYTYGLDWNLMMMFMTVVCRLALCCSSNRKVSVHWFVWVQVAWSVCKMWYSDSPLTAVYCCSRVWRSRCVVILMTSGVVRSR